MKYIGFSDFIEEHGDNLDYRLIQLMEENSHCECGHEFSVNYSLTEVVCSNPLCKYKMARRIVQFARDLQILGIGEKVAEKIAEKFDIETPLQLLGYEPEEDGELGEGVSIDASYKIYKQLKERNIQRPLWEYLRMANIPSIRDNAQKVVHGIKNFSELKEKLQHSGVSFIHSQLDLSSRSESDSVLSITIYNNLIESIDSLVDVEDSLNIYEPTEEITVVISKSVEGFNTKEAFINYLNTRFHGKVYVKKLNSVSKNIDYLVCEDLGSGTNKVKKANQYGIKIVNSKGLLDYLEETYG